MVAKGEIGRAVELNVPIGARQVRLFYRAAELRGGQSGNGGPPPRRSGRLSIQRVRSPHARFSAVAQLPLIAELRG
jgi:hypothetical protein